MPPLSGCPSFPCYAWPPPLRGVPGRHGLLCPIRCERGPGSRGHAAQGQGGDEADVQVFDWDEVERVPWDWGQGVLPQSVSHGWSKLMLLLPLSAPAAAVWHAIRCWPRSAQVGATQHYCHCQCWRDAHCPLPLTGTQICTSRMVSTCSAATGRL